MNKDVNLKIKSDSSNAEKGLNKVTAELNKLSKTTKAASLIKFGLAFNGLKSSVKLATDAFKAANAVIKETTELYKKQAKAEKQLEVAAANNPYLSKSAVNDLKSFASNLQKISTVGDEELIPMMAQLAAAGRTQTEIQDIMQAALDVSASGMMSLDSAVSALNKTYSGSVGLLGNQISSVKNLTSEQLKNGEAVKIITEQFKGMAEETAKATGSSEQLKNAIGDYKEELGRGFEKALSPMRQFFTNLIAGWTDAKIAKRKYNEAKADIEEEGGIQNAEISQLQDLIKGEEDLIQKANTRKTTAEKMLELSDAYLKRAGTNRKTQQDIVKRAEDELTKRKALVEEYDAQLKKLKEIEKTEADRKATADARATADKKAQDAIDKYNKTVADAEKNIAVRKKLGEVITENAEAQEMLSVRTSAYIQMLKDAEGTISGEKGFAKEEAERIAAAAQALQGSSDTSDIANVPENKSVFADLINEWQIQKETTLELQKAMLQDYAAYLDKKENLTDDEKEMREKLKTSLENIDEAIVAKQKEDLAKMTENINSYISEFANITQQMTDLIRSSNEAETQAQMADLDAQYEKGLISYEDYCNKKEQINKDAAQKEYKLKMWEWSASLLAATANIAEGVSKALTLIPPVNYIQAALVAASGAMQIATLTANKPRPPAFEHGGIVPGTSYHGDNVVARLNSSEMVLTQHQQKQLWNMANGKTSGGGAVINMPVKIENNASGDVSASAMITSEGLRVTIDRLVNTSMQQGRYNQSMQIASNKSNGVSIL